MYKYNLIIKSGPIEEMDAMVNRQLVKRFGPDVHYYFHAKTTQEAVVVVSGESKRGMQNTLGEWFVEDDKGADGQWPVGSLLHYREIMSDEGR